MGRTPIAEEAILIGVGVEPKRLDPADPGDRETADDIGLEVELVMIHAAIGEEALVLRVRLAEPPDEGVIDLIAAARDARPDRGDDPIAVRTDRLHRENRARPSSRRARRRRRQPRGRRTARVHSPR